MFIDSGVAMSKAAANVGSKELSQHAVRKKYGENKSRLHRGMGMLNWAFSVKELDPSSWLRWHVLAALPLSLSSPVFF